MTSNYKGQKSIAYDTVPYYGSYESILHPPSVQRDLSYGRNGHQESRDAKVRPPMKLDRKAVKNARKGRVPELNLPLLQPLARRAYKSSPKAKPKPTAHTVAHTATHGSTHVSAHTPAATQEHTATHISAHTPAAVEEHTATDVATNDVPKPTSPSGSKPAHETPSKIASKSPSRSASAIASKTASEESPESTGDPETPSKCLQKRATQVLQFNMESMGAAPWASYGYLRTGEIRGCTVVAILSPESAMAAHIPPGVMVRQNGVYVQTKTADEQATLQINELATYYQEHTISIPKVKVVILHADEESLSYVDIMEDKLKELGLTAKRLPYKKEDVQQGAGVFTIDGSCTNGQNYPLLWFDGVQKYY